MAADVHFREQRLRKQAELQSLNLNLANLRKQEASYIEVSAAIPEVLLNQINEVRREIKSVENELLGLSDETIRSPARQFYSEAHEAELAGDLDRAIKLYRNAARHNHPDAGPALRSLRYHEKVTKNKAANKAWVAPSPAIQSRHRLLIGLAAGSMLILAGIFATSRYFSAPPAAISTEFTATPTPPTVILIIPDTATPTATLIPSATPSPTPLPTNTPTSPPTKSLPTTLPSRTPVPTPKLPPKIIGPQNYLVWLDGAIVFEFEDVNLPDDELYCLNTLRGYDKTNTENWSFPPTGNHSPKIAIEANVIRVAKTQGMRCIVWSASIGKGSCEKIISSRTEERMIGLPQPCDFR